MHLELKTVFNPWFLADINISYCVIAISIIICLNSLTYSMVRSRMKYIINMCS